MSARALTFGAAFSALATSMVFVYVRHSPPETTSAVGMAFSAAALVALVCYLLAKVKR
jgi:hypothetical protein